MDASSVISLWLSTLLQAGVECHHTDLHGGGFIFGARWEGLVASIPISGIGARVA